MTGFRLHRHFLIGSILVFMILAPIYRSYADDPSDKVIITIEETEGKSLDEFKAVIPTDWITASSTSAHYEIHLESKVTEIERCPYKPTGLIIRQQIDIQVTLIDLSTDEKIDGKLFLGNYPDSCGFTETFSLGNSTKYYIGEPHPGNFEQWLFAVMRLRNIHVSVPDLPPQIQLTLFGYGPSYSPDGKNILLVGDTQKEVTVWDTQTGQFIFRLSKDDQHIYSGMYSPDGSRIMTVGNDTGIVWDAETGAELFELDGSVCQAVFSPDGSNILAGGCYGSELTMYDAKKGRLLRSFANDVISMAGFTYSPDGAKVVIASFYGPLGIWDVKKGEKIVEFGSDDELRLSVAYSPDGQTVISSGSDGLNVWDVSTGNLVFELKVATGGSFAARFSPDGQYILSASNDNKVRIWDVDTQKQLGGFPTGNVTLNSIQYSPDGKSVAISTGAGLTQIWDVTNLTDLLVAG